MTPRAPASSAYLICHPTPPGPLAPVAGDAHERAHARARDGRDGVGRAGLQRDEPVLAVDDEPGEVRAGLREQARVVCAWEGEPGAEGGRAGVQGAQEGVRGHCGGWECGGSWVGGLDGLWGI
ncbi:hypothetical protein EVG20_g11572 [Dentipellis fragilis]|uniref:Uncharacterized protein n=1 Tax=Dentipellis fragilis TaxID=205917 RepID=A0A4Y9XLZ0_9AGAM|nr:hypothetical protein EVG20_g11572 [Dentipellis fragilis]